MQREMTVPAPASARTASLVSRGVMLAGMVLTLASCSLPFSRPTPIAYREVNLSGYCSQTDEDGFREQATLKVQGNAVQALDWRLWVGSRGSCHFNLANFHQTQWKPSIELRANSGSCKLLIWQDPGNVTIGHANCEAYCTGDVYDNAWPVSFDPQSGMCARDTRR
ncbi:lipoprotein [Pandoraea anapnoica]|uniref:Lipoprotein n=2 Tax=Pandoraea anapnoica TaxID=2508301 RepID=A0A5E5A9T1_9BURK|nr:lipoprotein [Pandoraea anapnoica]